jgi:ribosomal protein S18 acetylase RimI-like enzyme
MSTIDILLLGPSDGPMLDRLAPGVFDHAVRPDLCAEFLADARHHLVVARDEGVVVGMAAGVHYVHPDKAPQLFINEVGVAPTHRAQGLGRRMLAVLVQRATELGCTEAWVLTDSDNSAANRLYAAAGAETPAAPCVMYTIPIRRAD